MDVYFKKTGGPFGDATCNYEVTVPEGTTVGDFVRYIAYDYSVKKGERGNIILFFNDRPEFVHRVPLVEYKRGFMCYTPGCNADIFKSVRDKVITKVRANGGWSCMGYDLYVD